MREIIHFVNKPDQVYVCQMVHREPGYVVLRYDVTGGGQIGPVAIPPGSLTIAHYRENAAHVLWEMYDPRRALIGYCYHICTPPDLGDTYVEYLDLLLDLWFSPDGTLTVLDEDELEEAAQAGRLSRAHLRLIARERATVERGHRDILRSLWKPAGGVATL